MTNRLYEIKTDKTWFPVLATSMMSVSNYCKKNGHSDFRSMGMTSRSETIELRKLAIVID